MYSQQQYYHYQQSIDPLQIEQTKSHQVQLDQSHEITLSDDDSILSLDSDLENYSNTSWSPESYAKPNNLLLKELRTWIGNYNISVPAVNDLLKILSKHGMNPNLSNLMNRPPGIPPVGLRRKRTGHGYNTPQVENKRTRTFQNDYCDISGRLNAVEQKIDMHQLTTQQILASQSTMQQTLNLILEKLLSADSHTKIDMLDNYQYANILPITTIEMLEEYESKLHNFPEFRNKMIQLLSQFGGPDAKKTSRSIVRAMIIDEVLVHYSWTGTYTKRVFSSFHEINSIIIGTMRQKFPNYTEYDNATFFKEYLKHASTRVLRHENSNKIL